jgi:RNA-directed DNA polymerase
MATKNKLQAVFEDRRARELGRTYLRATANKVAGVDGVTPKRISSLGEFCADVAERVRSGAYDARKLLGIPIPKRVPGEFRMICVPTVGDRVAQRLLHLWLIGNDSHAGSWLRQNKIAFGIGRGKESSAERARDEALRLRQRHPWVFKIDITKFFDEIPRDSLKTECRRIVRCPSLYRFLDQVIDAEIGQYLTSNGAEIASRCGIAKGRGLRQGMPLSPVLAALYLQKLDKRMQASQLHAIRYVDDIAIFMDSASESERVYEIVQTSLDRLGLRIPEIGHEKCKLFGPSESVEFLGMDIVPVANRSFELQVPGASIGRAESSIREFSTLKTLVSKNLRFEKAVSRMRNIADGYASAYAAASDSTAFSELLDATVQDAMLTLLVEAFGQEAVNNLPSEAKRIFYLD